jgi:hypothetical protein
MIEADDNVTFIKELQRDLARKYRHHGTKAEQIWRSLGKRQRAEVVKAGCADDAMLRDPGDQSLGIIYLLTPEWNLRDLTQPESDHLLQILEHRATNPLTEQYREGVHGGKGDAEVIFENMRRHNLRYSEEFPNSSTLFLDEERYGQSFITCDKATYREMMAGVLLPAVRAGVRVPRSTGELILTRQLYILQILNIVVQDILDAGSTSDGSTKTRPRKPEKAAREALSALSIDEKPEKLSPADLATHSLDQKSDLEDYLHLCRTEPVFLSNVVHRWFFSRPELVPDEMGRIMAALTDKYISISFFETIHNAIVGAAIWGYIHGIMQALVDGPNDRVYKGIMLQELSNVCHLEYRRAQNLFKRHVQAYRGAKFFKRISGVFDDGHARVKMKAKPDALARMDSYLNYVLRLCQPETDFSRAIYCIKKLDRLRQTHPEEREEMMLESEFDALSDLAVTTSFIQSLARTVRLPTPNPKVGQVYIARLKALGAELDPHKTELDLSDFAIPMENLEQPGMAEGALMALDRFVIDKTGAEMGFLYQDLNEGCLSEVQNQYKHEKAKSAQMEPQTAIPESPSPSARVEQRKEKSKTRPPHSSVYSIAPTAETSEDKGKPETPSPVFKVRPDTFEVFSVLFKPSPDSRGSIRWAAFEAAMADLKFTILPRFGSVFKFVPRQD